LTGEGGGFRGGELHNVFRNTGANVTGEQGYARARKNGRRKPRAVHSGPKWGDVIRTELCWNGPQVKEGGKKKGLDGGGGLGRKGCPRRELKSTKPRLK